MVSNETAQSLGTIVYMLLYVLIRFIIYDYILYIIIYIYILHIVCIYIYIYILCEGLISLTNVSLTSAVGATPKT